MKLLVNASNALAWITGNTRDTMAMKERIKLGYEGAISNHVTKYDKLGLEFQTKAATALLEGIDLMGKIVLDMGCGTGVLSLLALNQGAARVVCGDISEYMLSQARGKAADQGYSTDRIDFRQLDAESLPFEDGSFDAVLSSMGFGLFPAQKKAVAEMVRVLRPGGYLGLGAHGPEHYWEAIDASFRVITKRYVLAYRLEFWPVGEKDIQQMLVQAGFTDVRSRRYTWRNDFATGGQAFDFFAAISAAWWYAKFPPHKRAKESQKARDYFERKRVTQITDDVILAYGRKP
ncbi:MAG: class I SAM-dependent methyltransferase [Thermodesulfobacteriota bacterium]